MAQLLTTPRELLAARLRQMLWVELRLSQEVLPELVEQAHATDLKNGLGRHLLETESHVTTLRDVLHDLQVPADPEESPGLKGLVKEHEQLVKQLPDESPLLNDLVHAQGRPRASISSSRRTSRSRASPKRSARRRSRSGSAR